MANIKDVPLKIKILREKAGLPQHELARMADVTQAQISAYERGQAYPGLESMVRIAAALGTTVSDLLEDKEPKSAPPRPPSRAEMAIWILEAMAFTRPVIERVRLVLSGTQ